MTARLFLLSLPFAIVFGAFFVLPLAQLFLAGEGEAGLANYVHVLTNPRHFHSVVVTVVFSLCVTLVALAISSIVGVFLQRARFPGRGALVSMLAFPLSFPGTVIGFLIILIGGRQGILGAATLAVSGQRVVFAYSTLGLFVAYVYFSIPRTILTVMASASKLDRSLEEAARSLGSSPWQVIRFVILPGLQPALIAAGPICFATSMGAFGTAFTLSSSLEILPMVIYTEFSIQANIATASALSFALGLLTWVALAIARSAAGNTVAAG